MGVQHHAILSPGHGWYPGEARKVNMAKHRGGYGSGWWVRQRPELDGTMQTEQLAAHDWT